MHSAPFGGPPRHSEVLRYHTFANHAISTVSEWGMVAMVLLVLTAGTLVFMRKREAVRA